MTTLSTKQKQFLKGLAHHLNPVVMLGGNGLTEAYLLKLKMHLIITNSLKSKLLVQIAKQNNLLSMRLCVKLKQHKYKPIGHILVLYRPSEEAKIQLPRK